jgi:oligosaccharide repeat unit polymerase
MFIYAVISILILPLVGFFLLANGGYAISVGMQGFNNGVEFPYFAFFLCFVGALFAVKSRGIDLVGFVRNHRVRRNYLLVLSLFVTGINCIIFLSFLFVWGGISFFTSDLGRSEYRANLSGGMLYYWLMKIIAPGVFSFYFLHYLRTKLTYIDKIIFIINIFLLLSIGASTGFKSTFINLLLPIVFIYYWNSNLSKFFIASILCVLALFAVYFFVTDDTVSVTIFDLFVQRIFVAQSDVSWHVWNLYKDNVAFPSYAQSLMSILGSKFVYAVAGVDRSNINEWVYYDYSSLLMVIVGLPVSYIEEGNNIIGTIFSESLIALGFIGIPIFSLACGSFVAFLYNSIQKNLLHGKYIKTSMLTTYLALFVLPGIWGGGLTTFFNLPSAIGFFVLFITLNSISYAARRVKLVNT